MNKKHPFRIISGQSYDLVREDCHLIKQEDENTIIKWAKILAEKIPDKSILIPVPGHEGEARYTDTMVKAKVVEMIKIGKTDVIPCDMLKGKKRRSLCELKQAGIPIIDTDIGIIWKHRSDRMYYKKLLTKGYQPILIDNVIDTGITAKCCRDIMPEANIAVVGKTDNVRRLRYFPESNFEIIAKDINELIDYAYTVAACGGHFSIDNITMYNGIGYRFRTTTNQ